MFDGINIYNILISLPGILSAIIPHEIAHGYVSYLLGDPTAKNQGRLSLNPLVHLDPFGLLSMIILKFGWAKPVPINTTYYTNRKLGTIIVSLAGVFTNIILAFVFAIGLKLFNDSIISTMLYYGIYYNIILGVFNLIPLPPLDGSKVIAALLPEKYEFFFYRYERYFYAILIFLLLTDRISKIMFKPVNLLFNLILKVVFL